MGIGNSRVRAAIRALTRAMRWQIGATAAATAAAVLVFGAAGAAADVFQSTGGEQSFTVPAGVTAIHVVAVGGTGGHVTRNHVVLAPGGRGAVVTADVPVSAGTTLFVEVGQNGGVTQCDVTGKIGAFNGGGCGFQSGGGGSDIRTIACGAVCDTSNTASLASRLLVAGGGGGGSATSGGDAGLLGQNASDGGFDSTLEGKGGQTTRGGFGAAGACPSNNGTLGQGGNGPGGGGGGGLFGGGGGASSGGGGCAGVAAAGGGGGSSFVASNALNATSALDDTAVPQITITTPVPTGGTPSIVGQLATPAVGQKLTGSHGNWTNAPSSFADQWLRCDSTGANCAQITGATGPTYTPTADDLGSTIRLQETATNLYGVSSPSRSAQTGVVGAPPSATAPPSISGTNQESKVLSESHATWTNSPTSIAVQWLRCGVGGAGCTAIPGATGQTYTLTAADVGAAIEVREVAANAYGTGAPVSSAPTNPVSPPPTHSVTIVGPSLAKVGVAAGFRLSVVDSDGTPNSFRWIVDGHAAGSKSTLNFVFTKAGPHTVLVQVGDAAGNRMSATLIVTATLRRLTVGVEWTANFSTQSTTFSSLVAHNVPIGTHMEITCTGGGCPFAHHRLTVAAPKCGKHSRKNCRPAQQMIRNKDLTFLVGHAHLKIGAKLVFKLTLGFFVGEIRTLTIGRHGPVPSTSCLAPGATRPGRGC